MIAPHICIAIPTYNGAFYIKETLDSILNQNYRNFHILISDDCSTDETIAIIRSFKDIKIKLNNNRNNIGCSGNFERLRKHAYGDILYLLCQDDILLPNALKRTASVFASNEDVGAVTRPYYWFDQSIKKPVRGVLPFDLQKTSIIDICKDNTREIEKIIESVGQASGLAFKLKWFTTPFHPHVFVTHIYPFFELAKRHTIGFLKDYTIAVRIRSSQSRKYISVYDQSPTDSWMKMFSCVFKEPKYQIIRETGKRTMARHFVGLVQIKNYGTYRQLIHEIVILLKHRLQNVVHPKFWFYVLITLFVPRSFLRKITDIYKDKILSCMTQFYMKKGLTL